LEVNLNETIWLINDGKADFQYQKNKKNMLQKRKFRFPVDFHLMQAVGALTLHTGVGTI
jgi:hypothetical protein